MVAKTITYKNKTYSNLRSFSTYFGIPYDGLAARLREGVPIEEIVRNKGRKRKWYIVEGVFYGSISEVARVYRIKDNHLRYLHAKGYSLEAIVTGTYKDCVLVHGKVYKDNDQAFKVHKIPIDYGQRYLAQGFSPEEIIEGKHKEFTFYLEDEDVYLHTVQDLNELFHVPPTWLKENGYTYEYILENRHSLFYKVYGEYFLKIPQIARYYRQPHAELSELVAMGHSIEEGLEILHKRRLALQELFQDRSISNLKDACQKYGLTYSSVRRYMRNGLSLTEAIHTHRNCFEIKDSSVS